MSGFGTALQSGGDESPRHESSVTFMLLWNMFGALWLLPALARFLICPLMDKPGESPCGEGIHPRWVAKRPQLWHLNQPDTPVCQVLGLLCSPAGMNPLATRAASPLCCCGT
ncbi:protein of unknown function [Pseudomonas mediterranea]